MVTVNKAEQFERGRKAATEDIEKYGVTYARNLFSVFEFTPEDEADGGIAFANGYMRTVQAYIIANKE